MSSKSNLTNDPTIKAPKKYRAFTKSGTIVFISFTISILLFFALLAFGLEQIRETSRTTQAVVKTNNVKANLIVNMQKAARERSLTLYRMVTETDPFSRDEIYLEFKHQGELFIGAREQLKNMHLSVAELSLIQEQGKLSSIGVPMQNRIVDLLAAEKIAEASELLVKKAVPAQNRVLHVLAELAQLQHSNNQQIAIHVEEQQENAFYLISILGGILLLLNTTIAGFVIRHINSTERSLFLEKELAQVTLHSIGDGIITTDNLGIIQTINPVAESLTGYSQQEAIGKHISNIYSFKDQKQNSNPLEQVLQNKLVQVSAFDVVIKHKDGNEISVEYTAAPIIDQFKKINGAVIVLHDVTEMRSLAERLSYQASHDSLTGLVNRREFEIRLEQAIHNAQSEHTYYALCFIDLDQFKVINDTAGHSAGDEYLKQLAQRLTSYIRNSDVFARLGGDEFGILLDGCTVQQAIEIADEIKEEIKNTRFIWGKNSFETGASIGIVPINRFSSSVSELLSSADVACYEAKDRGRNRIQVFEPNDAELAKRRGETTWVQQIKTAIEQDALQLYYQDIVSLSTDCDQIKTVEILLRMQNNAAENIPPHAFLPTAERYNLMPLLDKWVISATFDFLKKYHRKAAPPLRLSINLSGQSVTDHTVLKHILDLLTQSHIDASHICFEITETAAIANMSYAINFISTLKQRGCKVALDDFGSGLSSFAYLKNMPIDNLKIDGVFIRDIISDPMDKAFVEAIHNIGEMMGIRTTAEFVESEEVLECVKTIGIDFAQGYYLAEPRPLLQLLAEN